MRGRAGYIHEYAKDLGMNDDEAVYPSFYLRQQECPIIYCKSGVIQVLSILPYVDIQFQQELYFMIEVCW